VIEVFQSQPPIAGSQRAETVSLRRECLRSGGFYHRALNVYAEFIALRGAISNSSPSKLAKMLAIDGVSFEGRR
jgi:hypothetical protein